MPAINVTQLNNASLDARHFEEVANSLEETATDRLGNTKSTVKGAVDTIKAFNSRGAWVASTAYVVKDLVTSGGTWYACVTAHTSSAAFATDSVTKWRVHQGISTADASANTGADLFGTIRSEPGAVATTLLVWARRRPPMPQDFMTPAQIADVASGACTLDVTAAVQAAFNAGAGKVTDMPPGVYRCTGTVTPKGDVNGPLAILRFYSASPVVRLVDQSVAGDLNFQIDGVGVTQCQYGLFVDTDYAQTQMGRWKMTIRNITNTSNLTGCTGYLFYKSSSATHLDSKLDIQIDVFNVVGAGNGVIGDSGGSVTGGLVSFNGTGCNSDVYIHDSAANDISSGAPDPSEDASGFHVYQGDGTSPTSKGRFVIARCVTTLCRKRGYKVQANNTTIEDSTCYGQFTQAGFETYSPNTTFVRCKYLLGSGVGFSSTAAKTIMRDCDGTFTGQQPMVYMYAGAHDGLLDNLKMSTTATFASRDFALLKLGGCLRLKVVNSEFKGSTNTGSGVVAEGTNTVEMVNSAISGVLDGTFLSYSDGDYTIRGGVYTCAGNGVSRIGVTAQTVNVYDTTINAGQIGLYCDGSGIAALVRASNSKINANTHGILAPAGSRITDMEITSTALTGYGILAGNSVARNNRITKYGVGIGLAFTVTAETANNVTIGSTIGYETTGYTPFVHTDNFSRA